MAPIVIHHGLHVMSEQVLFERMGTNILLYHIQSSIHPLTDWSATLQQWSYTAAHVYGLFFFLFKMPTSL